MKKVLQDIVVPEIRGIQVEIRRLDDRIDSLDEKFDTKISALEEKFDNKIGSLTNEMRSEFRRIDEKIDAVEGKLSDKIDALDEKFDTKIDSLDQRLGVALEVRERLAALEAKVGSMVT
ncbi:MAG: hypothetical protein ACE5OR_13230 [bacterium]